MTFDRESDWQQGYEDALNGFPRTSTRPWYRRGYDAGLTELLARNALP